MYVLITITVYSLQRVSEIHYHTAVYTLSTVSESSLSACVVIYPVRLTALFLEVVHVTVTVTVGYVPMTRLAFCYK